jgi:hypothetical protein
MGDVVIQTSDGSPRFTIARASMALTADGKDDYSVERAAYAEAFQAGVKIRNDLDDQTLALQDAVEQTKTINTALADLRTIQPGAYTEADWQANVVPKLDALGITPPPPGNIVTVELQSPDASGKTEYQVKPAITIPENMLPTAADFANNTIPSTWTNASFAATFTPGDNVYYKTDTSHTAFLFSSDAFWAALPSFYSGTAKLSDFVKPVAQEKPYLITTALQDSWQKAGDQKLDQVTQQ